MQQEPSEQASEQTSASQSASPLGTPQEQTFFAYAEEQERVPKTIFGLNEQSGSLAMPFQPSGPQSTHIQQQQQESSDPPSSSSLTHQIPILKGLLSIAVVLTVFVCGIIIFALVSPTGSAVRSVSVIKKAAGAASFKSHPVHPTPFPTSATPGKTPTQSAGATDLSGQHLQQLGWTQAGLTVADAAEAEQTATAFTELEMSIDYRDIGTATQHAGTLTRARSLLTAGGKVRFQFNDVRMINNTLYNQVRDQQRVQQVISAQPHLVQFQRQIIGGQGHQFAWVKVTFTFLVSQIDPTTKLRVEGLELDTTTKQPLTHQMMVLLLRVPSQLQGAHAPEGEGTGWLVNVYARDTTSPLTIATVPSL